MKWENSLKWKKNKGGKSFRNLWKRWNSKSRKSTERQIKLMPKARIRTTKNPTEKKPKMTHPRVIRKKPQTIKQPDLQRSKRSASKTGNKTFGIWTPTPKITNNSTIKTIKTISSVQSKLSRQTVVESMSKILEWSTRSKFALLANRMWENRPWSISF